VHRAGVDRAGRHLDQGFVCGCVHARIMNLRTGGGSTRGLAEFP
jgi:hypothetical protein